MQKIQTVQGDIVKCDAEIIVQQSNCVTCRPHGISDYIKKTLKVCTYDKRRSYNRKNQCLDEDLGTPGVCEMMQSPVNGMWVANINGQFSPSKPGKYYRSLLKKKGIVETYKSREQWFQQGLEHLESRVLEMMVKGVKIQKIAFPKLIGCGLAGGKWANYLKMIESFRESMEKIGIEVYLVEYKP